MRIATSSVQGGGKRARGANFRLQNFCAQVCPENVFRQEKAPTSLPVLVLVKVFVHGGKQAVVANEGACTACMKCVDACPEHAIRVSA